HHLKAPHRAPRHPLSVFLMPPFQHPPTVALKTARAGSPSQGRWTAIRPVSIVANQPRSEHEDHQRITPGLFAVRPPNQFHHAPGESFLLPEFSEPQDVRRAPDRLPLFA